MRHVVKRYVESCWWAFFLHGVVAIGFGLFALFTPIQELELLAMVVAIVMMALGSIELLRTFLDIRKERDWGLGLVIALAEIVVGAWLLVNNEADTQVIIEVASFYMMIRGLFDILIGLVTLDDKTDRFMWVVSGIFGVSLGAVMANCLSEENSIAVVWIFGLYATIFGLTNVIYAVHARTTLRQIATEKRRAKAKKARAVRTITKKAAKSAGKKKAKR